ncbi:DUF1778 domain-containing protein [Streptosporangium amethystogenes]|uniref:type II toxin-antitoxin system TacA family antitoxin n=1 Tax=Streptosporangium amethystogenes TaxID=2002 RepID=UPI0005626D41|nr:DUF1778 domain-containing protein [Streptosporangium amethystogenes]
MHNFKLFHPPTGTVCDTGTFSMFRRPSEDDGVVVLLAPVMTGPAPGRTTSPRHGTRSRLEARITTEDKNLIEQAARASRETVTGFVLHAALDAAEEVMRRERVTMVPHDFFEAIIDSLAAPLSGMKRRPVRTRRAERKSWTLPTPIPSPTNRARLWV